jgi:hypothetical protein
MNIVCVCACVCPHSTDEGWAGGPTVVREPLLWQVMGLHTETLSRIMQNDKANMQSFTRKSN